MNSESRHDVAILWCNHIDRKAGRDAVKNYLHDLKASHDALLIAIQGRFNDCQDQECNQCKDVRILVKAAEGLK